MYSFIYYWTPGLDTRVGHPDWTPGLDTATRRCAAALRIVAQDRSSSLVRTPGTPVLSRRATLCVRPRSVNGALRRKRYVAVLHVYKR